VKFGQEFVKGESEGSRRCPEKCSREARVGWICPGRIRALRRRALRLYHIARDGMGEEVSQCMNSRVKSPLRIRCRIIFSPTRSYPIQLGIYKNIIPSSRKERKKYLPTNLYCTVQYPKTRISLRIPIGSLSDMRPSPQLRDSTALRDRLFSRIQLDG